MDIEIVEEGPESLPSYASIPIVYEIIETFDVDTPSVSGSAPTLTVRHAVPPTTKDYDAEPGNGPLGWPARFDISTWGFLAARVAGKRVGGAVVVAHTSDVDMLEGREDLALLWDIRIAPAMRGHGAGSALLQAVEAWARRRRAHQLKVETQNTNVPACRFYARHGFTLGAVNRTAYPALPWEIQLLWYKDLLDVAW
jgi:GNAT superfamily N-acetyltransferase